MAARLTALLPRFAALVLIWLLAAAGYTFAAGGGGGAVTTTQAADGAEKPTILVVPDVRRQPYVYAKGMLQDGGFAWRVLGDVDGYAANTVTAQSPAPGTRVVDTGAPTVSVRLAKNEEYPEHGLPENESTYRGTRILLLSEWKAAQAPAVEPEATTAATTTAATTTAPTTRAPSTTTEPAAPEQPAAEYRKPDFEVAGAPREPADEMRLPARARLLADRVHRAKRPTRRLVGFWLYQHAWVVTGARFGWADGDAALRILIGVDERLQRRFDFGARSEALARRTLAEVLSRKD
jgi:hypothetical protein